VENRVSNNFFSMKNSSSEKKSICTFGKHVKKYLNTWSSC